MSRQANPTDGAIAQTLAQLVPQAIIAVAQRGGPSLDDWQWLTTKNLAQRLATEGDLLLSGQHSPLMGEMVRAVSLLAFLPGGYQIFGLHFAAGVVQADGTRSGASPAWIAPHLTTKETA